jgi:hypothetical protein
MPLHLWLLNLLPASGREVSGYVASALVLLTFCMMSMRPLRLVAIASNVAFIAYGIMAHLHPVLLLHSILLPVNTIRLLQVELARGVGVAGTGPACAQITSATAATSADYQLSPPGAGLDTSRSERLPAGAAWPERG